MFEEHDNINEFDRMMKSILDEGQEEVPARVWNAVSEGLDNAARRKTVVLWFRRTAIGFAAAAAVAIGVIFNINHETDIVPMAGGSGLIAVVEPGNEVLEEPLTPENIRIAEFAAVAEVKPAKKTIAPSAAEMIPQTASQAMEISETEAAAEPEKAERESVGRNEEAKDTQPQVYVTNFPEDWEEEETARKRDVSFIVSGLASTNSTQSRNRIGLMKAPTVTSAPEQTGITETSTSSTYGLPVSFGAGVKIGLSPRWSIGVGANYTILTRQFYGKYTKVDDRGNIQKSTSSDIRNTQHYVGIPVNAYYDIINKDRVNLYAYAGGTVEKCVADNYNVLSTFIRHTERVPGIQLSANAGIGVEFMLGKHLGLYIDPSVRYYFDCDQPKSIRTVQPLMLGFEMGFRARL